MSRNRRLLVVALSVVGGMLGAAGYAAAPAHAFGGDRNAFDSGGERSPETVKPFEASHSALAMTLPPPRAGTVYDPLPLTLDAMSRYEQIAMEPYSGYDALPLAEKARLYSQQFAYLHDREPVFSPAVLAEIERSKTARLTREELYKPVGHGGGAKRSVGLDSIAGPWSSSGTPDGRKGAGARAASPADAPKPPPKRGPRMETLRGGWNLRDAVAGEK